MIVLVVGYLNLYFVSESNNIVLCTSFWLLDYKCKFMELTHCHPTYPTSKLQGQII